MRILLIFIPIAICLMIFPFAANALGAASPAPVTAINDTASLGIHGTVTYRGVPSATAPLDLLLFDNNVYSRTLTSTITLADGSYLFTNIPTLNQGESYLVEYLNNDLDVRFLWFWDTRQITQYQPGDDVDLGTFDIENFSQLTPPNGIYQQFPVDFTWVPRSTPTEYKVHIGVSPGNLADGYYYSPIITNTDTFRLNQLPNVLAFDTTYSWEMLVFSPDGGYGGNTDWYDITFTHNQIFLPTVVR